MEDRDEERTRYLARTLLTIYRAAPAAVAGYNMLSSSHQAQLATPTSLLRERLSNAGWSGRGEEYINDAGVRPHLQSMATVCLLLSAVFTTVIAMLHQEYNRGADDVRTLEDVLSTAHKPEDVQKMVDDMKLVIEGLTLDEALRLKRQLLSAQPEADPTDVVLWNKRTQERVQMFLKNVVPDAVALSNHAISVDLNGESIQVNTDVESAIIKLVQNASAHPFGTPPAPLPSTPEPSSVPLRRAHRFDPGKEELDAMLLRVTQKF